MRWKYKAVMFLTLLILCVGSVCATEPNNSTIGNYNSTQDFKDIRVLIDNLEKNDANQANEIQKLKDNNTQLDKRVKALEDSNKQLVDSNKQKDIDIKELKESNKQLVDSNKQLVDSNKVLNNTVNNQSVIINELNNKLDLQLIEIKQLQADKDKLNAEIKENYKKLLESPKKEDYEQLKKDIADKDNKIKELNTKIKILNNILNINRKDVYNSLKGLSSTNIQNIKCGKYTFKLDDYLKIPLIKDGKKNVLKFKKDNGRLPNYVIIGDYKVPQNVYKKLYNL